MNEEKTLVIECPYCGLCHFDEEEFKGVKTLLRTYRDEGQSNPGMIMECSCHNEFSVSLKFLDCDLGEIYTGVKIDDVGEPGHIRTADPGFFELKPKWWEIWK
ncbi:hypothetical protein GUA87_03750 [Sneathiella sp. P13V-1]|uniref:hypothetical protein n=1 Tax=Sneathiella sp. P13V-1 TaxID=2697366 RepID=UPI00187B4781|nr:hypothetical protein [Sneathiella sp. P13V-1]MBE7635944.1 hypothetical protein [Sneathiella sp. P13V-1]